MTDNELLFAISKIMQEQIQPLEEDIRGVKLTLENNVVPRLQNMEYCYKTLTRDAKEA